MDRWSDADLSGVGRYMSSAQVRARVLHLRQQLVSQPYTADLEAGNPDTAMTSSDRATVQVDVRAKVPAG